MVHQLYHQRQLHREVVFPFIFRVFDWNAYSFLAGFQSSKGSRLGWVCSQFLDYAEFQALEQNPMTMVDWIAALDDQILRLRKNILEGNGTVSHQEAIEKAEREFKIYREREMRQLESDFDKAVKRLRNKKDEDDKEEV